MVSVWYNYVVSSLSTVFGAPTRNRGRQRDDDSHEFAGLSCLSRAFDKDITDTIEYIAMDFERPENATVDVRVLVGLMLLAESQSKTMILTGLVDKSAYKALSAVQEMCHDRVYDYRVKLHDLREALKRRDRKVDIRGHNFLALARSIDEGTFFRFDERSTNSTAFQQLRPGNERVTDVFKIYQFMKDNYLNTNFKIILREAEEDVARTTSELKRITRDIKKGTEQLKAVLRQQKEKSPGSE